MILLLIGRVSNQRFCDMPSEATPCEATPFEATPFEATPFEATRTGNPGCCRWM